jgi:hypothetical protein
MILISALAMFIMVRGQSMVLFLLFFGLLYLVPGILYLLCAIFLKHRERWSIIVALVLASLQFLFTLVGIVNIGLGALMGRGIQMVPLVIILMFAAAFAQLIYHLSRCFEAIKHSPPEFQRGFEPMIVQQPPRQT